MIHFHADSIELDLATARALATFAAKDDYRPLGVGLRDGRLCATNGHVLLRLESPGYTYFDGTTARDAHEGRMWSRSHVETAIKVARAQKVATIRLAFADMVPGVTMPPVSQVIPEATIVACDGPIGFDPGYLAWLELACKACGAKGAALTGLAGALDPLRFAIRGSEHEATAVVMPMRI